MNAPPVMVEAQNNADDSNGHAEVEGGAGDGVDVDGTESGVTEAAYDAHEARKKKGTKCQQKIDEFQDKVLEVLKAPVELMAPAPTPTPPIQEPQEYVDLAFAAMLQEIKMNLSDTEVMDLVEELEQVVHRVCREKHRRLDFQPNQMFQQLQPLTAQGNDDNLYRL